jgi:hypothetical protein
MIVRDKSSHAQPNANQPDNDDRIFGASVPNPKFAVSAATTGVNFGFEMALENYDSSVVFGSEVLLKVARQK